MPSQVTGASQTALNVYQALYGQAPSNPLLADYKSTIATSGAATFASQMTAGFAQTKSAPLATTVLTNLGVYSDALAAALTQMFDGYGVASRGQIILNLTSLLSNLEGDVTYGAAAVAYNTKIGNNFTYSSNTANTTPGVYTAPVAPVVLDPTYSITSSATSVNEGDSAIFTITTKNVAAGTVLSYALSGVSSADVVGSQLIGTTTVDATGRAVVAVTMAADSLTEGAETMTLTAAGKTASVTVNDTSTTPAPVVPPVPPVAPAASYAVTASPTTINEGQSVTYTVTTKNVAAGNYSYLLGGEVKSGDIVGGLTGTVAIDSSGIGYITATVVADNVTDGDENMTITIGGTTSATVVRVLDTSKTPPPADLVIALTTGLDTGSKFTGAAGSDTFTSVSSNDAAVATFTSADSITGGAGTDTLTVAISGTITTAPSVSANGIEVLSLTNNSTGGAYTLDATLMPGLNKLVVNGGLNNLTVNNSGVVDLELNSSSKDLTVTPLASAVAGLADVQTVTLNGVALSGNVGITYNGIETLNFVVTGATGDLTTDTRVTLTDTALKTANISGAGSVRLGLTTSGSTAVDAVGVVNASTATGVVDVTVAAGTSGLLSVTGGAGNDIVSVGAVTKEMTLAGGAGTDTLVVSSASKATAPVVQPGFNVSGFETLQIAASGSASMAAFPSNTFTSIKASGTATVSDLGTAAVTIDQTPATATGTLTATRATNGAADTMTVNLTPTTTGTFTGLSIANEDTATVRSSGVGTGANTITTLTGTDLKSLTITGDRGLTVTTFTGGAALATLDASANTGTVFSIDASNSLVAMTVKGSGGAPTSVSSTLNTITTGSGNDSVTGSAWIDNITTGNGNDTINAGAGNDIISAGAGNDVIDGGEGDNNISGGSGNDSITAGAGNDLIDGGGGSDTIIAGGGDDLIAITVLNTNTSIDGGAGTDRLASTTGTITASSATSVATAMVPVTDSAAPKMTSVNTAYVSITPANGTTAAATPVNLDFTGVTGVTTLFLNPIDAANNDFVKLTNFDGSGITAYGAITNSAELKSLVIDGVGQAALTVTLEDYDTAATSDVFTVTDVTSLTINSRSTSQFAGSSDQNSSLGVITADGVDTLRITTSGAGAANASAFTAETVSATVASTIALTAGANDTLKITGATGLAAATGLVTSFSATGGVASGFDIDKVNLGTAVVATATITVGEAGAISTDGNTTIAAGQATDFDAAAFTSLTVSVGASGVAQLDLSGITVTAANIDIGTAGSVVLVNSLGLATKASSYTFTGRGDLDFDTSLAVNNTVTLLGSTFTFNTSAMSVDNDQLVINASGLTGAGTITTGIGADSITGGASNDTINAGLGADTLVGGAGADTLTLTETLSNQSTDVVVINAQNGVSTNSARVQGTSTTTGDDTGEDRVAGFELANDVIEIRATGVVAFVHGDHTTIGTATATTTTGVATEFTKLTLLVDLSSTAATDTISIGAAATGDIAVTFTSPTNSGVAVTDLSAIETTVEGRLRYNLTGSDAANTITGGALADTIDGGAGADQINGGAGADVLTGSGGADTFVFSTSSTGTPSATNFDSITDYTTGSDIISFGATSIVKFATAVTAASGTAGVTVTTGVVAFNAADNTQALRIAAVAAALGSAAAGNSLIFTDGTDSFIYITNGTTGVQATDVLIRLVGLTGGTVDELLLTTGTITGLQ